LPQINEYSKPITGADYMNPQNNYDLIDGRKVPQLSIKEDYVLTGTHEGTVLVESGLFVLNGIIQGSLYIQSGVTANIFGSQQGTVTIGHSAKVIVTGAIEGSTTIEHGATLIIEASGRLAGALTNYGKVIIRGVFGGPQTGNGELKIEGNGYIKQPTVRDGITYYEW
jgi:cytoskeletal protein CcmA (bactofilin family)